MIRTMLVRNALPRLALSLLAIATCLHAETGAEGWLRYAPLPRQAAQQYKNIPHRIVTTGSSAVAHSAANELARGLHSMLGENPQISSAFPGEDSFILGTPAEIQHLVPTWKSPSPSPSTVAPEGFSLSRFAAEGHN